MGSIKIETTQNVFIEYELADVGNRILAFLVDTAFKGVYLYCIFFIFFSNYKLASTSFFNYVFLFSVVILPMSLYSIVQEVFMNGQTFGKKLLHIKVITSEGGQPTLTQYLVRWIFRLIDIWFSMGIVGIIFSGSSKLQQRLGDLAADTCLIKLKSRTELEKQLIIPEFESLYNPVYTEVMLLSDYDVNIIKNALQAYKKYKAADTLQAFAVKVKEILNIKSTETNEKFLLQVVKDYTYLTSK